MPGELPDHVDPRLAFRSSQCNGDDYLYDAGWPTFPGRMAAYSRTVTRTTRSMRTSCPVTYQRDSELG